MDSTVIPTVEELCVWLRAPMNDLFHTRVGDLRMSCLSDGRSVPDGTVVLLLRNSLGQCMAVVLCSSPAAPDMVHRSLRKARDAKSILGPSIGQPILDPIAEGKVQGLTYAVLPYCQPLSEYKAIWMIQRALLRRRIFDWLWKLTERTVSDVGEEDARIRFLEPLRYLAALELVSEDVRSTARRAVSRIETGSWKPRLVLMHGDLWKGNILIRGVPSVVHAGWRDRFAIIDWAGSEPNGFALYDLTRLAQSMRMSAKALRWEAQRHCKLLRCAPIDSLFYLVAALGYIAMNLEHFPIDMYRRMAELSYSTLTLALR